MNISEKHRELLHSLLDEMLANKEWYGTLSYMENIDDKPIKITLKLEQYDK